MIDNDCVQPIRRCSRGFVRKDGTVFGWSLLTGEHRDYHATFGTTDADYLTRWRQWSEGGRIDIEVRPADPAWLAAIEQWIADHADEEICFPGVPG